MLVRAVHIILAHAPQHVEMIVYDAFFSLIQHGAVEREARDRPGVHAG